MVLDNGFYKSFKTFVDIIRVRNVLISVFGVFVGAMVFSIGSSITLYPILAGALSAGLILGGGNAINDYFDYEIDKINKPKRPIPSGRISRSDTFILSLVLFLIGLGLSKSINNICLTIAGVNTFILLVYGKYSKRMLLVSNLSISYLVASVFIFGAGAVWGPTSSLDSDGFKLILVLTFCSFLINLSREIIKDIEDIEGDSKAYSSTLPIRFGVKTAKLIAIFSGSICIVISILPIAWGIVGFNEILYGLFIILTDMILIASFTVDPAVAQRLLIVSMTLALVAFMLGITPQFIHPIY